MYHLRDCDDNKGQYTHEQLQVLATAEADKTIACLVTDTDALLWYARRMREQYRESIYGGGLRNAAGLLRCEVSARAMLLVERHVESLTGV